MKTIPCAHAIAMPLPKLQQNKPPTISSNNSGLPSSPFALWACVHPAKSVVRSTRWLPIPPQVHGYFGHAPTLAMQPWPVDLAVEAGEVPAGPYNITGARVVLDQPASDLIATHFGAQTAIQTLAGQRFPTQHYPGASRLWLSAHLSLEPNSASPRSLNVQLSPYPQMFSRNLIER